MIEIRLRKIVDSLAYIILLSFPLYYALREYSPISSIIFALIVILSFACCAVLNIMENSQKLSNSLILEILIVFNIAVLFIFFSYADRALILLLLTLIISKCIFFSTGNHFEHAANAIIISSIVGSIGVILGFVEVFLSDTNILYQVMDFDYPYSNGTNPTILVNGFFASANGSAYCIGAGLAFVKYQTIFQNFSKKIIYILLIISLAITKAKFAFLIFAALLIVFILKSYSKKTLGILLLGLGLSYIFLSHIIVAISGSYNYPSIHFREILFSIKEIDFILGNYGIYKLYSLEAVKDSLFIPLGLSNFELIYGSRPHFMFGSLIVYGGISIAIFTISYLYIFLKESINNLVSGLSENIIYFSILFAFLIETVNWDFSNNFYFWALIFSSSSILHKKIEKASG
tara:strand:- start:13828 stop:15036 length:1209 start_codon:yes stop_codon:yes gene_type:complete